jgi:hypothetical protein
MGNRNSVRDCHTADEFGRCVRRQGGEIEHGKRHDIAHDSDGHGSVAIPRHDGDLATETRHSISKALLALGFLVILCVCGLLAMADGGPSQAQQAITVATAALPPGVVQQQGCLPCCVLVVLLCL